MEFQAVIMAAGRGSRMTDLTARIGKPLLPVANKPVIWYPINLLAKAGFEDIIVVVLKSALMDVKRALDEVYPVDVRLDYFTIPDDTVSEDFGTADTLRLLADKIKCDMLVVSCDLVVGDESVEVLHELADLHRTHNAAVSMLITPVLNYLDGTMACPGGHMHRTVEKDFIGLDRSHERVLFLSAESDLEEVALRMSQLKRFPFVEIHTQLVDAHLYFLKKRVVDDLLDNRSIKTIKGDLIPLLVRQQFNTRQTNQATTTATDDTKNELMSDVDMSQFNDIMLDNDLNTPVICCAKIVDSGLCIRANTLIAYCDANRQVARRLSVSQDQSKPTSRGTTDSTLGTGVTIGDKAIVKSCVIGDQCVIGDKVKLTNCVIMDHVTVETGCTVTGCIVCSNARLEAGAELRDCLIGVEQHVTGKHTNEMILELIEITDDDDDE